MEWIYLHLKGKIIKLIKDKKYFHDIGIGTIFNQNTKSTNKTITEIIDFIKIKTLLFYQKVT